MYSVNNQVMRQKWVTVIQPNPNPIHEWIKSMLHIAWIKQFELLFVIRDESFN